MSAAIRQLLQQGAFEQVLSALPDFRVLRNDAERLHLRAVAHAAVGEHGEAVRCAERGTELEPDEPRFHLLLASLIQVDDPQRARGLYVHVISLNPNLPDAHAGLGLLAAQRGELEQAESQFRTALRAQADHTQTLLTYGRWLLTLKRVDEALALFNQVLRREPQNPDALALAGRVLTSKGNLQTARKALDTALAIFPQHAESLLFSAQLRLHTEDLEAASVEVGRLLQLRPNDQGVLLLGSEIALRGGAQQVAVQLLTRLVQLSPRHEQAILKLADLYMIDNPGAAAGLLARSAQLLPESDRIWLTLLSVLRRNGAHVEAQAQAQQWTRLAPTQAQAWAHLAFTAEFLDQHKEASAAAEQALQLDPGSIEAGLVMARVGLREHHPARALAHLDAMQNVPDSGAVLHEVQRLRARAFHELGQLEDALTAGRSAAAAGTLDPMPAALGRSVSRSDTLPAVEEVAHVPLWFLVGTPGSGVDALGRFLAAQPDCLVLTDRFGQSPRLDVVNDSARWLGGQNAGPLAVARSRYLRGMERMRVPAGVAVFDWLPQLDVRAFDVLRVLLPRARFLIVQRDPRDALLHGVLQAANGPDFADPLALAEAIGAQTVHLAQILATHGAPLVSLGFEQLQSNSEAALEQLATAMGRTAFVNPAALGKVMQERGGYPRYLPSGAWSGMAEPLAEAFKQL